MKKHAIVFAGIATTLFVASIVFADATQLLMPTANGSLRQFTPSAGTNHAALVDEAVCNGTTDYNRTTTVGHRDSYTISLATVPNGALITDVALKPCASRQSTGGGSATLNVFYRLNGATSSDAGAYALPTGTTPVELATTTYSSLTIDKTSTSTAESGVVYTSGTKGVRVSRLAAYITYSPLTPPSGLVGVSTTTDTVELSWTDNSTFDDGFAIERSTDLVNWTHIASTSAMTYRDTGLSAGTTYYHRVRTHNAGVYSAYSGVSTTATIAAPPSAPTGFSATASTTVLRVALAWTDTSSDETSFQLERRIGAGAYATIASLAANTVSYDDTTGVSGTTYEYRVSSFSTAGGTSTPSNTASATFATVPSAPTGFGATASTTAKRVSLSWTDTSSDETAFKLERRIGAGSYTTIASLAANTVSYDDTTGTASTTYEYRVSAFSPLGTSTPSNTASATFAAVPVAPSGLSATLFSASEIDLAWTDNATNEVSFDVQRRIGTGVYQHIASTSADVATYHDSGLAGATTYVYRVRAWNGVGYSAFSGTATSTTP
jgi:fibronectin type 3 domain-containing protein